ncbi:FAD-binding oxidoreductase, partial [Paenarthrobacter sp. YJN-5]|uniref:NAD(P)/FAD-dependent oxidoreductase n=1 Tax=Paenarthrobacter sp. YJN-5 TaxID=2735316 RepID=UPI001D0C9E66
PRRKIPVATLTFTGRDRYTTLRGTTSNCRRSAFSNGLEATAALSRKAFSEFDAMQMDGIDFERHDDGILQLFLQEQGLAAHAEDAKAMELLGMAPAQILSASEVRSLEPAIGKQVIGGILNPYDQFIDPASFVEALAARCLELGVRISTHEAVGEILPGRQGIVSIVTKRSEVHRAAAVVVAAGAQSGELLRKLGTKLPLQAGKGYGFDITRPPINFKRAIYLSDHKVAVTPLNSSLRLAGTMEFGSTDLRVDDRRAAGILRAAPHYFNSWSLQKTPVAWAGLRPMTPDGLPMIGHVPGHKNVFVAAGHAMLGITLGPITGSLLSSLILAGEEPSELTPFDPARF